jgi:hypothetical protein
MNNKSYSHILDDVAGDQVPQSLDLAPNILNRIQKRKGIAMQPRTRISFAILTFVIVLGALVGLVPGVAAAIGRWFGYVPGVGLVAEGQVRVLAEPVRVTREGVTVTVEQVVADKERTSLVYSVDGIPNSAVAGGSGQPCTYSVGLRLPDGSELKASPNGLQYWGTGYQQRFNYAALPATVNDAVMEISCLYETLPGAAPDHWQIPLHLVASSSAVTAYPVIEIPTANATQTASSATAEATTQTQAVHLTLDRAVQMDDGYLIYATLHWEDSAFALVETLDLTETLHLSTSDGQGIAFEEYFDELTGVHVDQRQTTFAIKTAPLQTTDPLRLTLDWVSVSQDTHASFVFDPGTNPTEGQTWTLNQEVQAGDHTLTVRSATAEFGGFNFEMTSADGIIYATLVDLDHPVVGGGGGGSGSPGDAFFFPVSYDGNLPRQPVTVTISSIAVQLVLNLQAEWTPPAASTSQLPTQGPACLTADTWNAALTLPTGQALPAELPAGLGGRVLTGQYFENPPRSVLTISDLDGANPQTIENAEHGSFSPDGTKLAYSLPGGGIMILDLATNQAVGLPGTGKGDINPGWTPDGSQIVFNRGMGIFDLFIANPDGTNLRSLTSGGLQEWRVGWLADGRLLYQVPGRENENSVVALDVQTGATETFSNENVDSISPDGKWMVTLEKPFGDRWLTSVSAIDGANRRLLADSSLWMLDPTWSPDGQWLLAGVSDSDAGSTVGALIHLDPCQVIALPELKGSMEGWR